jgi:hypothetical protein
MTAPDRVGAKRNGIGCNRHPQYAHLFNGLKRCSSPRHGAGGGWHFCEMPTDAWIGFLNRFDITLRPPRMEFGGEIIERSSGNRAP